MAKEIVNELTPITKELQQLNNKTMQAAAAALVPVAPRIGVKRDSSSKPKRVKQHVPNTYGPLAESFMNKYMEPDLRKREIDTTFGIRYENPRGWMIGKKDIEIDVDDIIIDGEVYISTPGLWSLITSKSPKDYTEHDLERYKELLFETSALHQHYNSRDPYPRSSGSKKVDLGSDMERISNDGYDSTATTNEHQKIVQ